MPESDIEDFQLQGTHFYEALRREKARIPILDYGWYPYDSLALLPEITALLKEDFPEVWDLAWKHGALDLGCGDGDFGALLASQGVSTDAVDHAETDYNQMRGVQALQQLFQPLLKCYDIDVDSPFDLPRKQYGLVVFLGTLYHLKNPFYVLEKLAAVGYYCLLSTRIAQVTAASGVRIASEPLAYLLDPREINNDSTNFWVFSETGLLRLLHRSGWVVRSSVRVGCRNGSNPTDPDKDERMILLLRSGKKFSKMHVRTLDGWHAAEEDRWRWTAKRFSIEVVLPRDEAAREFGLKIIVPEAAVSDGDSIELSCNADGLPAGRLSCIVPGPIEFRGTFPARSGGGIAFNWNL